MYFNGNYGNYWQLDNDSNMQLSEKEVAIATRAYFATISFTDSEIGRVLDAARALGEKAWGEMVVVLWSDHGQNVGTAASTLFWAIFHAYFSFSAVPSPPRARRRALLSAAPWQLCWLGACHSDVIPRFRVPPRR